MIPTPRTAHVLAMIRANMAVNGEMEAVSGPLSDFAKLLHKLDPAERPRAWKVAEAVWGEDAPAIVKAVADAKPNGSMPPDDGGKPPGLAILGMREFMEADYPRRFLVNRVLVKDRPCVLGGPRKSLKTSIALDLAVSLAGASPFLGEFGVPAPVRSLIISGESGPGVIQETVRRSCRVKDLDPLELEGRLFLGFDLPQLSSDEHLDRLAHTIRSNGVEVVIIDPLYLCLTSAERTTDMANLFDVGPLLKRVADACLGAGATPILIHHYRKNRANPFDPPELEDLAFSGIQEFARQWILLSRRERFEPGLGEHKLWLAVGGSDGHSGEWAVDIREGVTGEDFRDRDWSVSVAGAHEARDAARQAQECRKALQLAEKERSNEARKLQTDLNNARKIIARLESKQPEPLTKSEIKSLTDLRGSYLDRAITLLRDRQVIEDAKVLRDTRNSQRKVPAIRLTGKPLEHTRGNSHDDHEGMVAA